MDLDGICSAAIVKYFHSKALLYPFDYGMEFPFDLINQDDEVYLVDISLPPKDMVKLNSMCDLRWIDHHVSAINKMKETRLYWFGRQEIGVGACELCWKYFSNTPVPKGIHLLSEYDVWRLTTEVVEYQLGLKLVDLDPRNSGDFHYNVLREEIIPYHCKNGRVVKRYLDISNEKSMHDNAFLTTIQGHSAIAVNQIAANSLTFKSHPLYKVVDILCKFGMRNEKWHVSFYSLKDSVDVSQIALMFGGGGHFSAAACQVSCLENVLNT